MFEVEDIIKSADIYLAAKDKNLKYLYCNENVARGLGLDSPSEIVGKTDHDLFKDDVAQMYRSGDAHVLKGGILVNAREIQPHTDKIIKILTTKNQLKNKLNKTIGVVISFIDITNLSINLSTDILQYDLHKKKYKIQIGAHVEFFTQREYEVFKYILAGLSTKQIASKLFLSSRTIEDYVNKIKQKLQCSSKYHIVEAAMRLGILQQNII